MQSSTNSTVNRSTHDSSRSKSNTPALRVIPLGGLHEIGKNTCVFEYGDELMLVDAGLAFPSDGMHGVNVVMPDTTFLKENQRILTQESRKIMKIHKNTSIFPRLRRISLISPKYPYFFPGALRAPDL